MKKIGRLTESDLTRLVRRVIKEMDDENISEELMYDYMKMMNDICDSYFVTDEELSEDDVLDCLEELYRVLREADKDKELNDKHLEMLYDYLHEIEKEL